MEEPDKENNGERKRGNREEGVTEAGKLRQMGSCLSAATQPLLIKPFPMNKKLCSKFPIMKLGVFYTKPNPPKKKTSKQAFKGNGIVCS